jgi:UDP-glucose 4-epimerase
MEAVVTGGAGFIGSHLVDELISLGYEVHVIDNFATGHREHVHPDAILHVLDIRAPEIGDLILSVKPDVIFHQAAQVDVLRSIRDPLYDASVNILGTINLLDASRRASVQKFIYASSSAVYGNSNQELIREDSPTCPISAYGISKLAPESFIRLYDHLYGLPYTILRYANVYGPRQSVKGEGGVVAAFLDRIKKGLPLEIHGDGEQTRDFVYVRDVVKANVAAVHRGHNEVIQVGTGVSTSVKELVATLETIHGSKVVTVHKRERPGDIRHSCLDNSKARTLLQWTPRYDLKTGLGETYSSVMNQRTT